MTIPADPTVNTTRPPKRVAILQSNYIPWKGYFDMIDSVDEFILYDDVQYTKRDWRNRNQIKTPTPDRKTWLTIPVNVSGKYEQKIRETLISSEGWSKEHWKTLQHTYAKAPYFKEVKPWLDDLYGRVPFPSLSEVNYHFISAICEYLGITSKLSWSSDYTLDDGKNERLIGLCLQAGATTYLSGPAAQDYMDVSQFNASGLAVEWMSYKGYPEYPQLYGEFEHGVTVLDVIFNTGKDARQYIKKQTQAQTVTEG